MQLRLVLVLISAMVWLTVTALTVAAEMPSLSDCAQAEQVEARHDRLALVSTGSTSALIGGSAAYRSKSADLPRTRADFDIPPDSMAFYRFDPTGFATGAVRGEGGGEAATSADDAAAASSRAMGGALPAALLVVQRAGLVDADVMPIIHGLIGAGIAGRVPHSVCLLDLDLTYDAAAEHGVRVLAARAVLEIETGRDHHTLLNALDGIISHYAATTVDGRQTLFDLPNGRQAGRFEVPSWGTWRTLEWASLDDSFIVGLGHGSLEQWQNGQTAVPGSRRDQAALERDKPDLHRTIVNLEQPSRGPRFLELWVDLEAMHARMPDVLAQGRVRDQLVTWQLDNARNYMLHGRWSGRFLLFDITWQRRSEPALTVAHRSLTRDAFPPELRSEIPAGDFVIVAPFDHDAAFSRAVEAYANLLSADKRAAFQQAFERWRARHRRTLPSVLSSFQPWVVVSNVPRPPAPIPGACSLYFEIHRDVDQRVVSRQMDQLLSSFFDLPTPEAIGGARVVRDNTNNLNYLQIERTGLLRSPAWGWAGGVLIGGWGPPVVIENRDLMSKGK